MSQFSIFLIQIKCVLYLFLQKKHIIQSMRILFFLFFTTLIHAKTHERKMKIGNVSKCYNWLNN